MQYLEQELANCEIAASNAHLAATDDQSVAETQYDTLAIESAYLAEGQSRRIIEFKASIHAFEQLAQQLKSKTQYSHAATKQVSTGSLVQLSADEAEQQWFFIAPAAGGYRTSIKGKHYTLVTGQSPMGKALMGKQLDDEIEVSIGNNKLIDEIIAIL